MLSGKRAVSGRGPTFECVCKPDLVAPGRQIMACTPGAGNLYSMKSGTSMSTPLVSGAIALALEKDSLLSNVEIKMMLRDSCDDMGLPRNQQDGEVQLQKVFGIIGKLHYCINKNA